MSHKEYFDVLTTQEVCEILGVSKKTVYKLLKSNELTYKRIGSLYRIRKQSLIEYLEKQ